MSEPTGTLLREVARLHLQSQRSSIARCSGTTLTQCFILTELGRAGELTLANLGRRLGLDKSWTSRAVDSMVGRGLLRKSPGTEDRRTILISLSTGGQRRHAELNRSLNTHAERVIGRIPKTHRAAVRETLEWLREALRAEVASAPGSEKGGYLGKSRVSARRAK